LTCNVDQLFIVAY